MMMMGMEIVPSQHIPESGVQNPATATLDNNNYPEKMLGT